MILSNRRLSFIFLLFIRSRSELKRPMPLFIRIRNNNKMAHNYFQAKAAHDEMKHAMKEQKLHMKAGNALAHGNIFKAVKLEAKAAGESMKKEMAHSRASGGPFGGHRHHHPHHHHRPHYPPHPHHHAHRPPHQAYPPHYPGAPGHYPAPASGPAYPTGTVAPPPASYPPQAYHLR